MNNPTVAWVALLSLLAAVLLAAWRTHARVHVLEDFVLARRRLSASLTGVGQAVNCFPMWLLMSVVLAAYTMGLAAIWLTLAYLIGLSVNWWFVAPKLRAQTAALGCLNLSQWFASSAGDAMQAITRRSAGIIALAALGLTSVTVMQWSVQIVVATVGGSIATTTVILTSAMLLLIVSGGMWSAALVDILRAALACLVLASTAIALTAASTWGKVWATLLAREPVGGPWFAGYSGILALSLLVGMLFAAFGSAAQPHVIARYLACRDEATLRRARLYALYWSVPVLAGALITGLLARLLIGDASDSRSLVSKLMHFLSPSMAAICAVSVAIALLLAGASPWVAAAAHLSTDLPRANRSVSLTASRTLLFVFAAAVCSAAIYLPPANEDRFWLAWHGISAAFGPLMLVRLTGKRVRPGSSLGAMWAGCILTILFHFMPGTPGDLMERSLPFIASMGIALSGGERRRNPDRADRGDKTVHDHLPI